MSFEKTVGMASTALIGCGLLTYGLYQKRRLQVSQGWPQVTGTITKADLVADTEPDAGGYFLSVAYEYVVNGVLCTGSKIGFRRRSYIRKKRAQTELDRYRVNSGVPVYYDPENPADAVLVRESPDCIFLIVSGIALLALAVVGSLWG